MRGTSRVMEALAAAMVSMTEAEVFQLDESAPARFRRPTTCGSFAKRRPRSCRRAAGSAGSPGADTDAVEALATYGERIGIAFQIIDDSLDFAADPTRLGKAIGHDLLEGKRTLPLIVTLDRATSEERARILETLGRPGSRSPDVAEVHRLVKVYDGVGYSVARASAYAETGIAALGRFPDSPGREILP